MVVAVALLAVVVMVMTMVTSATAPMMMVVVLLLLTGRMVLLPQLLLRLVMLVMHWKLRCGLLLFHKRIFNSQVTKESLLMWINNGERVSRNSYQVNNILPFTK